MGHLNKEESKREFGGTFGPASEIPPTNNIFDI